MIYGLIHRLKLRHYIRQGLQIADDCRLIGTPDFGSEPYLVSVGRHVTISGNVTFVTHDGGTWVFRDQPKYKDVIKYGRITIHDNCFIGNGTLLMPGISIGPNSVVASRSVVTRDVPPNSVAAGVPARVIKTMEAYAESSLASTPDYDKQAYRRNKVSELLRLYPRPW
jgi:acetyltransferase-like isoleucine patch superfamily enzyme